MFKIKSTGENFWDIYCGSEVVATIEPVYDFRCKSAKGLIALDGTEICRIKNQKEALVKLEEYLEKEKEKQRILDSKYRKNMNFNLEKLVISWEQTTGEKVTDEMLDTPDFICSLIKTEWYNIKNKLL